MGGEHKKAEKDNYYLDAQSNVNEMFSAELLSIGFGGLHLGKALVCTARNYVLAYNGEHFGVHILRELKQACSILQTVNNAALVGRDKQSDILNYTIIGEKVQQSLKSNKEYLITRVPEKYLNYKEEAKTQNRIVMPAAVATNRNGDVFLVDSGSCCVHVVDNSSVAVVRYIGTYDVPSLSSYKEDTENIVKMVRFGNQIAQIYVDSENDDVLIFDRSREEVVIIDQCTTAKKVLNRRFYILKVMGAISVVYNSDLFVLQSNEDGYYIQKVRFQLPTKKSVGGCFNFQHRVTAKIPLLGVDDIKSIFYLPYANIVGCYTSDNNLPLRSKTKL